MWSPEEIEEFCLATKLLKSNKSFSYNRLIFSISSTFTSTTDPKKRLINILISSYHKLGEKNWSKRKKCRFILIIQINRYYWWVRNWSTKVEKWISKEKISNGRNSEETKSRREKFRNFQCRTTISKKSPYEDYDSLRIWNPCFLDSDCVLNKLYDCLFKFFHFSNWTVTDIKSDICYYLHYSSRPPLLCYNKYLFYFVHASRCVRFVQKDIWFSFHCLYDRIAQLIRNKRTRLSIFFWAYINRIRALFPSFSSWWKFDNNRWIFWRINITDINQRLNFLYFFVWRST